jgi:ABC-type sugar transport system substrate-binding protein
VSRRPAGIILAPLQSQTFVPVLQEVKRAGIPIVLVANDVPDEAAQDRLSFVGPDNYDTGKRKAEWLAEKVGGQGEVVVIHFIRGHPFTEAQRRAYEEVFKKYPGISVVEGPYGSSSAEGLAATENVLSTHPEPAGIFFDGDDVALGGIKAVKERGLAGRVVTVASDGTTAAVQAVRNGDLDLTISVRPYKTGTDAVDVLVNYVEDGTRPSPKMYAPLLEITRETVDRVPPEELAR